MRRCDMHQVHDVTRQGQRPVPLTRQSTRSMAGAPLMRAPKLPLAHVRQKHEQRDLLAGCLVCSGRTPRWTKANAQALAAQHHDRTGHATWVTIATEIQYGNAASDPRQTDIEDAIASARSSDRPSAAPLSGPDAPAAAAAPCLATGDR
jgi:hypothetical protein